MRMEKDLILDVLDAIEAIERYASRGKESFESDELVQVWILYHLQIIGEASRAMSKEVHDADPTIPWKGIIGMRNILVHQYSSVEPSLIWEMVVTDIPVL
ncbi:MAG: DUF86 domain-containing protein, partial [Methanospirillum sp.]|uniref:HepT-like ribonuclease domain-containing protein n=1 Tax=Methanospirillum sp. TaxID=45200 RepID=UPI002372FC2E